MKLPTFNTKSLQIALLCILALFLLGQPNSVYAQAACTTTYTLTPASPEQPNVTVNVQISNTTTPNNECVMLYQDNVRQSCSTAGFGANYNYDCTVDSGSAGTHTLRLEFGNIEDVCHTGEGHVVCNSFNYSTLNTSTPTPTPTSRPERIRDETCDGICKVGTTVTATCPSNLSCTLISGEFSATGGQIYKCRNSSYPTSTTCLAPTQAPSSTTAPTATTPRTTASPVRTSCTRAQGNCGTYTGNFQCCGQTLYCNDNITPTCGSALATPTPMSAVGCSSCGIHLSTCEGCCYGSSQWVTGVAEGLLPHYHYTGWAQCSLDPAPAVAECYFDPSSLTLRTDSSQILQLIVNGDLSRVVYQSATFSLTVPNIVTVVGNWNSDVYGTGPAKTTVTGVRGGSTIIDGMVSYRIKNGIDYCELPGMRLRSECLSSWVNHQCSVQANVTVTTLPPWIQTTGGDVHSNTGINAPGGP